MARINVADVEPKVAVLKVMNDCDQTSSKDGTKVGHSASEMENIRAVLGKMKTTLAL